MRMTSCHCATTWACRSTPGRLCGAEDAGGRAGGLGGRDGEEGVLVDGGHLAGLLGPVGGAVLDDAERVDPQVPDLESARNRHGVLEGLWELLHGDVCGPFFQRICRCDERYSTAPAIAETKVLCRLSRFFASVI